MQFFTGVQNVHFFFSGEISCQADYESLHGGLPSYQGLSNPSALR